jgi:hypothetical protein
VSENRDDVWFSITRIVILASVLPISVPIQDRTEPDTDPSQIPRRERRRVLARSGIHLRA